MGSCSLEGLACSLELGFFSSMALFQDPLAGGTLAPRDIPSVRSFELGPLGRQGARLVFGGEQKPRLVWPTQVAIGASDRGVLVGVAPL